MLNGIRANCGVHGTVQGTDYLVNHVSIFRYSFILFLLMAFIKSAHYRRVASKRYILHILLVCGRCVCMRFVGFNNNLLFNYGISPHNTIKSTG